MKEKKISLIISFSMFFFLLLFVSSMIFTHFFVVNYIKKNRDNFFNFVEQNFNLKISYSSISPSIIGKININTIKIHDKTTNTPINVGTLTVHYSLFSLLQKEDIAHLNFIKKISLKRMIADISLRDIEELQERFFSQTKPEKNQTKLPPLALTIEIINSHFNVELNNKDSLVLYANFLRFNLLDKKINIKSSLKTSFFHNMKESFSSYILLDGDLRNKNQELHFFSQITFHSLTIQGTKFHDQKIIFKAKGDELEITRIKDIIPIVFEIKKSNDIIQATMQCEQLTLNQLIRSHNLPLFPKTISGKINVDYIAKEQKLTTSSTLQMFFENFNLLGATNLNLAMHSHNKKLFFDFIDLMPTRGGALHINGDYNIPTKTPSLNFNFNQFPLVNTSINGKAKTFKIDNELHISSEEISCNDVNLGGFSYVYNMKSKDFSTITPYNGLFFEGNINNDFVIQAHQTRLLPFLPHETRLFFKDLTLDISALHIQQKRIISTFDEPIKIQSEGKSLVEFLINYSKNNVVLVFNNIQGKLANLKISFSKNDKNNIECVVLTSNYYEKFILQFDEERFQLKTKKSLWLASTPQGLLYIKLNRFEIPLKQPIFLHGQIIVHLNKGEILNSTLSISELPSFHGEKSNLQINFSLKENKLIAEKVLLKSKSTVIQGSINGTLTKSPQSSLIEGTSLLIDEQKKESYSINFKLNNGIIASRFFITNMQSNKILGEKSSGTVNFRLGINGKISNPEITIEGETKKLTYNKKKIRLFFVIKKINKEILIDTLTLHYNESLTVSLNNSSFMLNNSALTDINIRGDAYLDIISKKIKTNFNIKGFFGSLQEYSFDILFPSTSIAFLKSKKIAKLEKFENARFSLINRDNRIALNSIHLKFLTLNIAHSIINAQIFQNNKRTLQFTAGIDKEKNIRGSLELYDFPIKITNLITAPYVDFHNGFLNATINLKGNTSSPIAEGKIFLYDGEITIPDYLEKPITKISAFAFADGKKIQVVHLAGNCNGGLVNGYGEVGLNNQNKFDGYKFIVNSEMVQGAFSQGPVVVNGKAKVDNFIFEGHPQYYAFIADIFVEQGIINLSNFNNDSEYGAAVIASEKKYPITVDMNFTTGKRVEVNYPLISGVFDANQKLAMHYTSEDKQLSMIGDLSFKSGEINYMNKKFKIEEAKVRFSENDQGINPYLNITSSYATKDFSKNKLTIFMNITDYLFSFKTNFTSNLQLSELEINQLLGITPQIAQDDIENIQHYGSLESLQNTSNYIGNTFLFNPLENYLRRAINVDVFNFHTNLFGNVLSSDQTFLDMLDDSSLAIGKYITDGFYLESMMTFNKNNGISNSNFIPIPETDFGLNVQLQALLELPFISLGYSYKPVDIKNFADAEQIISIETSFKF